MQREHSKDPRPKMRVAFNVMTRTVVNVMTRNRITQNTPKQNRILAALSLENYACLLPSLEPISLPLGSSIYGLGMREEYLYFLTKGIVAVLRETENGGAMEATIKGSEGVIGIASFLGSKSRLSHTIVLSDSYAYRVRTDLLISKSKHVDLLQLLQRYILTLIGEVDQATVCKRHHSVEKRLCSFTLTCLDRLPSNELSITHEQLCAILGVRLESLVLAAENLRLAGLIKYSTGNITVIDRRGMEILVCECYATLKRGYYCLHPV